MSWLESARTEDLYVLFGVSTLFVYQVQAVLAEGRHAYESLCEVTSQTPPHRLGLMTERESMSCLGTLVAGV